MFLGIDYQSMAGPYLNCYLTMATWPRQLERIHLALLPLRFLRREPSPSVAFLVRSRSIPLPFSKLPDRPWVMSYTTEKLLPHRESKLHAHSPESGSPTARHHCLHVLWPIFFLMERNKNNRKN